MVAAAVLNFTKSVILSTSDGRMTNRPTSAGILNFQRVLFRPPETLVWGVCNCRQNLVQIGQELAEIQLFVYF